MMNRDTPAAPVSPWMNEDLAQLRTQLARFLDAEMVPRDPQWRSQGHVGHEIWRTMGAMGFLCTDIPQCYGGAGGDFRHEAVVYEELGRRGLSGFSTGVHNIAAHYLLNHGTEEQKARLIPLLASGQAVGAIAMTEPGAGSDLQGIRTRAVRDGDDYIVNGSKIFITNGYLCELLALVVRTGTARGPESLSILFVETRKVQGYRVGRVLDKMGMKAQDTAELFFEDMRVPAANLLGGVEGKGFYQLMADLPYERLLCAVSGVAAMEGAVAATLDYIRTRRAFGKAIADFQNSRFKMAEAATITRVARCFVDACIQQYVDGGKLDAMTASMAKYWCTDMQQQVIDECVQQHGGYGYMNEYLVCRMFADTRVQRIYGGTNEIMKELIARQLLGKAAA